MEKSYAHSLDSILESHNLKQGLNDQSVQAQREKYGENRLEAEVSEPLWKKFLAQFNNSMILILMGAALVSFFMDEAIDAIIILSIVFLNALLGLIQEDKAEKSLAALKKLSAPSAKVVRNGQIQSIPADQLVVGDLLTLEAGDIVAADVRLIETHSLQIQEASLTGESVPVEKDAKVVLDENAALADRINMAFGSSHVTYGRGLGLVVSVGMNTEVGQIAKLIQSAKKELTPLQRQLDDLGKILGIAALFGVAILFGIGVWYGRELFELFMTSISLAVAVIPESLPAVATIVLALGVQRLAKQNAIVRNLSSVETLGSANVVCSDKTGTLTQNKMTVVQTYALSLERLNEAAFLCNDARWMDGKWVGDPTETALSEYASLKVEDDLLKQWPRMAEKPFDSNRKRMSTLHHGETKRIYAKGGVDEILSVCTWIEKEGQKTVLTQADIEEIHAQNTHFSSQALRVLAFAYKDDTEIVDDIEQFEKDLVFVGLLGMMDPARPEVIDAISKTKEAGIEVVMITGDHPSTAVAIAQEIGLMNENDRVMTGLELDQMPDDALEKVVKSVAVYARVSPTHKIRIVEAWKKQGAVVAMTGDGVNDAPALKKADIGAAMGVVGTEVAKSASDMVLADDNFATIISAIEEGRRIKDNILKSIAYLLSCNVGELTALMVAMILNWASPLLSIHILWVNLVTDSLPALALGVDPAVQGIMKRKPSLEKNLINRRMTIDIIYQGLMIGVLTLIAFYIGSLSSIKLGQTMAFAVLAFSQLVHSHNLRSTNDSIFTYGFSNRYLLGASLLNAFMMVLVLSVPQLQAIFKLEAMSAVNWLVVLGLSLVPLLVLELVKTFRK